MHSPLCLVISSLIILVRCLPVGNNLGLSYGTGGGQTTTLLNSVDLGDAPLGKRQTAGPILADHQIADNESLPEIDERTQKISYPLCSRIQCANITSQSTGESLQKRVEAHDGRQRNQINQLQDLNYDPDFSYYLDPSFTQRFVWQSRTDNKWFFRVGGSNQVRMAYQFYSDHLDSGQLPTLPCEVEETIENKTTFGVFYAVSPPTLNAIYTGLNLSSLAQEPESYNGAANVTRIYHERMFRKAIVQRLRHWLFWSPQHRNSSAADAIPKWIGRSFYELINNVTVNAYGSDARIGWLRAYVLGTLLEMNRLIFFVNKARAEDQETDWSIMSRNEAGWLNALLKIKRTQYDAAINAFAARLHVFAENHHSRTMSPALFMEVFRTVSETETPEGYHINYPDALTLAFQTQASKHHSTVQADLQNAIANQQTNFMPESGSTYFQDFVMKRRLVPATPIDTETDLNAPSKV